MTDNELKFFDPETGKPLHRVPEGATIPKNTPYGCVESGERWWRPRGLDLDLHQEGGIPRFTREPIAPPTPPMPTEPGLYLDKDGRSVERTGSGEWYAVGSAVRMFDTESHAPLTPATAIPTETWDRLRVLDPEDKRDRVDRDGRVWGPAEGGYWRASPVLSYFVLETLHHHHGPLRFADEVNDGE